MARRYASLCASTSSTAARIAAGPRRSKRSPAPSSAARRATAPSSDCWGASTMGTPHQMLSLTLFIPQWVRNTDASPSTRSYSTLASARTLGGRAPSAAAPSGLPTDSSTSHGPSPRPSAHAR